MATVHELFEKALARRGLSIQARPGEGLYVVAVDGASYEVSLDNAARDFARDGDPAVFDRLVELLVSRRPDLPSWAQARSRVYFLAQPAETIVEEVPAERVTRTLARFVVYWDREAEAMTWVTNAILDAWGIDRATLEEAAAENQAGAMRDTPVEVREVAGHRLGLLRTDSPLKASLIFSPVFKEAIAPHLGWPVFAVVPCRDFALFVPATDEALLSDLGDTVMREYTESRHPISPEVLLIGEEGIQAIGAFAPV